MQNPINHTISEELFSSLKEKYPQPGKNSHIGNWAVEIVKEYLLSSKPEAKITKGIAGSDLDLTHDGQTFRYEVKGTESPDISFGTLRVSSEACYNALKGGMPLVRVCNIGRRNVTIYILKHGDDFVLREEKRWIIARPKKQK